MKNKLKQIIFKLTDSQVLVIMPVIITVQTYMQFSSFMVNF